jgi:uncharacterized protein (TIRG00374 family)
MSVQLPEPLPRELSAGGFARRAGGLVLVGLVVALLISTLPGLDEVRERFAHAEGVWLVALFFLEVASCLSFVVAFRGVFCTRLGWRFSYEIGMAEQGTNVLVPAGGVGGLALGAWALRQGGMSADRIARRSVAFFVLTSAPNFLCAAFFGLALATGVLPGGGPLILTWALGGLAVAAIVLVAVLPRILRQVGPERSGLGANAGRRARATHFLRRGAVTIADGVHDAAGLLKARQPYALLGSIGYMALDVAALAAAFAAFGSTPPFAAFVFAYVIGQLGGLIPLPGGIGGIDGGLIGTLAVYGASASSATAAVLAYRLILFWIPLLLGAVAFWSLRRSLAQPAGFIPCAE